MSEPVCGIRQRYRDARAPRPDRWLCAFLLLIATPSLTAASTPPARIDFDRDVRPILSENCFTCHGFDAGKRQADLRLDIAEAAVKPLPSGKTAFVAGNPRASAVMERVTATDGRRMPPASTGKTLTAAQIDVLRRWIAEGARYGRHWAFVPPRRPALPAVKNKHWARNPIDRFILARLEQEGLPPSSEADRATLIRRLCFDLTGLPPTLPELNAFLADRRPDAYERLVDRLLASPRYGERMALGWLDLARYADTHGYHIDSHRDMWPWRDWVIAAFNRDLPFDQFTIQQLAGDLLPNATRDQQIATGFNRNHPITFEGGAIAEEYQAAYIADRIDTTATTWMGLTVRCAQCHDHKYDPITQQEYYRFYAYFNSIAEKALDGRTGNAAPFLKVPTPDQETQLAAYDREIAALEQAAKARAVAAEPAADTWARTALAALERAPAVTAGLVGHYGLDEEAGTALQDRAGKQPPGRLEGRPERAAGKFGRALAFDGQVAGDLGTGLSVDRDNRFSYGAWVQPTGTGAMTILSRMEGADTFRGWDLYLSGGKVYVHLIHAWETNALRVNTRNALDANQWSHVFVTYDGSSKAAGVKIYINGKPAAVTVTHDTLTATIRTAAPLRLGRRAADAPYHGLLDEVRLYDRELTAAEVGRLAGFDPIRQIAATPAEQRTAAERDALRTYYLENEDEPYRALRADLAEQVSLRSKLDSAIPTTMVMQELEQPRESFLLIRGQYDQKGEKVTPGTPAFLPALPAAAPPNRLALARWLVDPAHPLTARVAVNRFWQQYFGAGLVRTAENFGTQGERPSHPELLDWLATEFMGTCGWSMKKLQRLIVTSATYRQSSRVTPRLLEKDPENRLLARAPRLRLSAELIRDQALAVSGLLTETIGGPSVRPYQPPGLWEEIAFGREFSAQRYEQDHGDALYRRGLYTFWKRTCPPAGLQILDAPEREFCMVRRTATNTPLQALVLMNDPGYVEAARKLAERLLTEVAALPRDRIRYAYRLVLARPPNDAELRVLLDVFMKQQAVFRQDRAAAEKLLAVGESPRNAKLDVATLAAWSAVASVLLNLDETITKG